MIKLKAKDCIGKKFGRLTIIEDLGYCVKKGTKTKKHYVKCVCDCGKECIKDFNPLKEGRVVSCGCYNKENIQRKSKKYNEYKVYKEIVFVKFTNYNEYFICDLDDWNKLKDFAWLKLNNGYAATNINGKFYLMHRLVMKCDDDMQVDHIYHVKNGVVDNRKKNLRVCNNQQNNFNKGITKSNKSGYVGVLKVKNKWIAQITFNYKNIHLGVFDTVEEAIDARKKAEIKYFGEYRYIY